MPFAGTAIPSIQLPVLEGYLLDRDINVKSKHLYLKAAEFYGLNNYNFLISGVNEPYKAQMVYSKYLFEDHWEQNKDVFREYFNKKLGGEELKHQFFDFDKYVNQTDNFLKWVIEKINWKGYDIIGFSLNYGQFLPSLSIAKNIKQLDPDKKIILGGSRSVDRLGIKIMESFDYIDFIVSGEGEEPLYRIASDYENYNKIPNLIYKNNNQIIFNESQNIIDINSLSIPSYNSFFKDLYQTDGEIIEYFNLKGMLPIEISRGCWWNKCSFCSQKIIHKKYREKNVKKIVEEIDFLSDKYKILDFQLIGDTLIKNDFRLFSEEIKRLKKDFTFFVETRAGVLKRDDYRLLKEAGFTAIQTGIETFSQNYIKKMNKGTRIIDNIATLKYCKENDIKNNYNLIVNYPNEEKIDFEETLNNVKPIIHFLDPPAISYLIVEFGSHIYENPKDYNIEKFELTNIDKIMFPNEFLEKGFCCIYNFKRKIQFSNNEWEYFIENWRRIRSKIKEDSLKSNLLIDNLILYFVDGGNYIKIYDKRRSEKVNIYVLDEIERIIFLYCIDVVSFNNLVEKFSNIPDYKIKAILNMFEKIGIIFREDDHYLSLPLYHKQTIIDKIKDENKLICYN
jgi:ribosomal peptide maturation radical SAM protein 1